MERSFFPNDEYIKLWAKANCKPITFELERTWVIENFTERIICEDLIESDVYSTPEHDDIAFQLALIMQPNQNRPEKSVDISLGVRCTTGVLVSNEVPVSFWAAIKDSKGKYRNEIKRSVTFEYIIDYKVNNFAKYFLSDLPRNNKMLINNKITKEKHLQIVFKAKVGYVKTNKTSLRVIADLESGHYSDVTFLVKGTQMPAHKITLSECSPIFKAMFSHQNLDEENKNIVNIVDFSANVFKSFLLFIYADIKPKCDLQELLKLADKYQVSELKFYLEDKISSLLEVNNVIDNYRYACLYNAAGLKENCKALVRSNFGQVVKTEAWDKLCKEADNKEVLELTNYFYNV